MSARLIRLVSVLTVWFVLFHPSTFAQSGCVARASRPPWRGHPARALWRERDAPATAGEIPTGRGRLPAPQADDPVLRAMQKELERSKSQLKLEQMATPYYIEYRVVDVDGYIAEAAFGALRTNLRAHLRFVRVVVSVGDYKQDSYFGQGEGVTDFMPLDDDEFALRHHLWLATDKAYKAATEALTAKQAQLKQLNVEHPVDDFARAAPVQFMGPVFKLQLDPAPWLKTLQDATALYKTDPQLESIDSSLQFQTANRFFVNSEGTVIRSGQASYQVSFNASTQAADGMQLQRSAAYVVPNLNELPSSGEFLVRAKKLVGTLRELRAAPVADEEYRGPVLFSADAASTVFADLVGENILGLKPGLGQPARTRGAFASSYKSRVLPEFLSVVDDPTLTSLSGKPLLGSYEVDDEGVQAMRVSVIEKGKLVNYLLGREPILDFPASNGHGRARAATNPPGPSLGNMVVSSSEAVTQEELKKKLLELCQQRDLPYGYYVETMGGVRTPPLLYKVWVKDGHEELVRGAVFGDLDARALRNDLVAAGSDMNIENRVLNVPHSIVTPSVLFDELEVKRQDIQKSKLPEYPAPAVETGNRE
ncbi:MAG TPA: metallopeptidase TldD-related protein [Terriglobia bacterium]|nr:metallopeptidase TldD-related protein [Terriglobia bacterium]